MRVKLGLLISLWSLSLAQASEVYNDKAKEFAACLGTQVRHVLDSGKRPSADALNSFLEVACGPLEKEANDAFDSFISAQIGKILDAETAFKIMIQRQVSPEKLRSTAVDAYRKAILGGK